MGSAQNDDWRLNEESLRNGGFLQRAGNLFLHTVGKQYITKQKFDGFSNVCFFPVAVMWHVLAGVCPPAAAPLMNLVRQFKRELGEIGGDSLVTS